MTQTQSIRHTNLIRHDLYGKRIATIFDCDDDGQYAISHSAIGTFNGISNPMMCNRLVGMPRTPSILRFLLSRQVGYDALMKSENTTEVMKAKAGTAFMRRLLVNHGGGFLNCKANIVQSEQIIFWLNGAFEQQEAFVASPDELTMRFGAFLDQTKCGRVLVAAG